MSHQSNKKYDLHFVCQLVDAVDVGVYWKNREGEVLGCNRYILDLFGLDDISEAVNRFELASSALVEHRPIYEIDQGVLGGTPYKDVGTIVLSGHPHSFLVSKQPLRSGNGAIVGIVAVARDITELEEKIEIVREKAALDLAAELKHAALDRQGRIKKIVDQIAHDIRSPLSSMLTILQVSRNLPERERKSFSVAAMKINEVTGNLLRSIDTLHPDYRQEVALEETGSLLVAPIVLRILVGKKYEYQKSLIHYECHFTEAGSFAWVDLDQDTLWNILSRLIDQAVARLANDAGRIRIQLDANHDQVIISIEDNGTELSPPMAQPTMQATTQATTQPTMQASLDSGDARQTPTSDTDEFEPVHEILRNNDGKVYVVSHPGIGTKVALTFPRASSVDWIAESINLRDDDIVVIVADDQALHIVWDERLQPLLVKHPDIMIEHFESAQAAVDFVHAVPEQLHSRVFIFTDYELLNQSMNGLDVVENTGNPRAVLITNRYSDLSICQRAVRIAATVLPKQLMRIVPIYIAPAEQMDQTWQAARSVNSADVIFVDDDRDLLETFALAFGQQIHVDTYCDPTVFLENAGKYRKDAKIFLDYQFNNFEGGGVQLALRLHAMQFTRIYLLTGMEMEYFLVPDFLTVISKIDVNELVEALKS